MSGAVSALAVYDTLAPGQANHWVLRSIGGEWLSAVVRGWVFEVTWGPAEGHDGFVLDADGPAVTVDVVMSAKLDAHLHEIDAFQGPGYERRLVPVVGDSGDLIDAWIYLALTEG